MVWVEGQSGLKLGKNIWVLKKISKKSDGWGWGPIAPFVPSPGSASGRHHGNALASTAERVLCDCNIDAFFGVLLCSVEARGTLNGKSRDKVISVLSMLRITAKLRIEYQHDYFLIHSGILPAKKHSTLWWYLPSSVKNPRLPVNTVEIVIFALWNVPSLACRICMKCILSNYVWSAIYSIAKKPEYA